MLLQQLTEKERAKLKASGLSVQDYFAGEGIDVLSDEEAGEDEQDEGDVDGDEDDDDDGEE